MHGKIKIQRERDHRYHLYYKNWPWQRWKPYYRHESDVFPLVFDNLADFAKGTQVEAFDRIILKMDKYSGMIEH